MLTSGNVKGFYPIISHEIKSCFFYIILKLMKIPTLSYKSCSSCTLHYIMLFLFLCFVNFQFLSIVQSLTIYITSGSFLTNLASCIRTLLYILNYLHKNIWLYSTNCFISSWGQILLQCARSHSHYCYSVLKLIVFIFIVSDSFRTNN